MATKRSSTKATTDTELVKRAAQHQVHGGLVVLRGGYWDGNTLWLDEYRALPKGSTKRVGYEPTSEFEDNPLGYGRARVFVWVGDG
jgi:hypothetical protein